MVAQHTCNEKDGQKRGDNTIHIRQPSLYFPTRRHTSLSLSLSFFSLSLSSLPSHSSLSRSLSSFLLYFPPSIPSSLTSLPLTFLSGLSCLFFPTLALFLSETISIHICRASSLCPSALFGHSTKHHSPLRVLAVIQSIQPSIPSSISIPFQPSKTGHTN